MKNLIKFSIVMVVLCITACTQTFENTSNEVQKKAQGRLVMKVGNESRTIKPTIGESDVKTAVLTANGNEIKSWSDDNIISQIQDTEDILLDVGNYDFTMIFRNADDIDILTASTSQGIVAGDNILDFDMKPVTNGYGNISITLTWDVASGINKIKAGLYDIATNDSLEGFGDRELEITTSNEQIPTALYSLSQVPVGQYIIKFKIYAGETYEKHLNTLSEVINVAAGITTSSQITLSQINTQYLITYNLNDGAWAENFTPTYNRNANKKITLPTANDITREGYEFGGWYDNDNNKITEIPSDIAQNISVTAKWLQLYTIKYNLNGGINAESNPTSYTVETETITLGAPTKNDTNSTFLGWYNDSGESITEIKPSETVANITVTARWSTTCTADNVSSVITSLSGDGPHDIVVQGGITSDTITTIKSALDTLKQNNSTAKVNLNLSETTGLTSIGESAFSYCTNLTSIIIPYGVTSIGDSAFSHCSQLISITFPESVTTIGNNVFDACSELTSFIVHESNQNFSTLEDGKILCDKNKETLIAYPSAKGYVTILNGIKTIAGNAFIECKELTEISIPDSVTTICDGAFANTGFISVSLPDSITEIGINVFFGCSSLETVKLPNRITSIPNGTFFVCSSLSNIEIPDDVTSIGGDAFSYCNSVRTLVIGNGLTSFDYLPITSALESITIGDGITEIGDNKFYEFTNLRSVTIGSGVTKIGTSAFENCTGLTSVTIPDNVTSIGYRAFENCNSVKTLVTGKGLTSLDYLPITSALESITIGENITSIANDRFYYCQSLESVEIPDKVTSIGSKAFYACINLKNVTIGNGVKTIGESAFQECNSLESVKIPDSVTSIGKNAFHKCYDLTTVEIGSGVETIGDYAFYRCDTLTRFIVNTENPNYSSSDDGIILCNKEGNTLIAYPTAKDNVEIPNFIKTIGARSFESMTTITSVTIPEGITTIENNAFDKCSGLTSVTFAENSQLTTIGEFAFYQCTSLTSIDIPDSVTTIGQQAFNECSSLESVEISENAEQLLESTFFKCTSLKSVIIPDSVTTVGMSVFSGCTNLESVKIGAGMTEIGAFMFNGCGFTSIVIPAKITKIGAGAFGASKLEIVNYTGSETQWNSIPIDYTYDNGCLQNATINYEYTGN